MCHLQDDQNCCSRNEVYCVTVCAALLIVCVSLPLFLLSFEFYLQTLALSGLDAFLNHLKYEEKRQMIALQTLIDITMIHQHYLTRDAKQVRTISLTGCIHNGLGKFEKVLDGLEDLMHDEKISEDVQACLCIGLAKLILSSLINAQTERGFRV